MTEWHATMVDRHRAALLVVDLQADFLAGGALAVPHGDHILADVRALLESERFRFAVAIQDWHPPRHASFASCHPGKKPFDVTSLHGHEQVLWPDHCVRGTPGADLCAGVPWQRVRAIVRKGMDLDVDSYSAFRNNHGPGGERSPTGLAGYLRECGIRDVYVCGLGRDYCVKWTAQDAADLGFKTTVIWSLTRPFDHSNDGELERELRASNIALVDHTELR